VGNKRDVHEESNGQYVVQLYGSDYLLRDSLVTQFLEIDNAEKNSSEPPETKFKPVANS
jgi:hypothetical protein